MAVVAERTAARLRDQPSVRVERANRRSPRRACVTNPSFYSQRGLFLTNRRRAGREIERDGVGPVPGNVATAADGE
ncbi:hypothetical protein E5288_WYG019778 [Bos mutus]|uniref:Uncharacterized protein n=1 Tax=Bos mutus TaxID=72004 RepID=A0A6B0RVE4_9CETA|nr:hypothetical protein [Bos mutus]